MTLRSHFYLPVTQEDGSLIPDITVRVYEPGTTQDVEDTLFVGPTGSSEYTSPVSFPSGVVDFYLALPRRFRLGVTPAGQSEFFLENRDAVPSGSNAVLAQQVLVINGAPQPGQVLVSNTDGTARWAAGDASGPAPDPFPRTSFDMIDIDDQSTWTVQVASGHFVLTQADASPPPPESTYQLSRGGIIDHADSVTDGRNGFIQAFQVPAGFDLTHVAVGLSSFTGSYTIDIVNDFFDTVLATTGSVTQANDGVMTPIPLQQPLSLATSTSYWVQVTADYVYTGSAASTPAPGVTPLTMHAQYGGTPQNIDVPGGTSEESWRVSPAGTGQFGSVTDGDWQPLRNSDAHDLLRFELWSTEVSGPGGDI